MFAHDANFIYSSIKHRALRARVPLHPPHRLIHATFVASFNYHQRRHGCSLPPPDNHPPQLRAP